MNTHTKPSAAVYTKLIQQRVPNGQLGIDETAVATLYGNLARGISPTGSLLLLIPVARKLDNSTLGWSNHAVSFDYRSVTREGNAHAYLVVECTNSRLNSTFCLLVDDILEAIARSSGEPEGAAKATLERWRALLRDQRRAFLSEEALVGLLGELTFLEELTQSLGSEALTAWLGPMSGRHDFVSEAVDVEVKSTTAHDGFPITIHGASQLTPAPGAALYLRGYRFDSHPGGDSIPAVLDRLRGLGIDRLDLLRLTELLGYSEVDDKYYASRTYSILESKTCLVDENFPRLTADTVPADVLSKIYRLSYTVDLGTLPAASIQVEEFSNSTEGAV